MFYISADQVGDRIFHRYLDEKNEYHDIIKQFPIDLYVKTKKLNPNSFDIMGVPLGKVEFDNIHDANSFYREYKDIEEIYGQTNFIYQFLSKTYPDTIEFDINQIPIMFIDIECAYDNLGFPHPKQARQQIVSIACKMYSEDEYIVFGLKECSISDITYILCEDEKDLLIEFQKYWRTKNPAIVTGWNVESFDIPYIINRGKRILGNDFIKKFSFFHESLDKCIKEYDIDEKNVGYHIIGTSVLDYLPLYKKFHTGENLESYRLEVVAQFELNEGKLDYSEYTDFNDLYERNHDLFIEYNKKDVNLVYRLEKKVNYIFLTLIMSYIAKIRFEDIHSQVRFWDTYIYNELQKRNIQIPPNPKKERENIVGAFVKDPIPNLYEWIVTLDLVSLYPSIIRTFNLSPETIAAHWHEDITTIENYINMKKDLSFTKRNNVAVIANGSCYKRDKMGIFNELVTNMFKKRKEFQAKKKEAQKKLEHLKNDSADKNQIENMESLVSSYDAQQLAFKISINSLYGASASPYFRFNNRSIAEGITMTGQLIIRFISNSINRKMNQLLKTKDFDYIVFNDTDSAGINFKPLVDKMFSDKSDKNKIINFLDRVIDTHIQPFIKEEFAKLTEYLNAYENCLVMNREVIADRGLWRGKKNYILQVWDREGFRFTEPKLKMMGIETIKSSTPKIVRGSLEKAIKIILNDSEDKLQDFVSQVKRIFLKSSLEDIAFPRGITDIEKYQDENGNPKKGCPIHVRGSLLYNRLIKKYKVHGKHPAIANGMKVKYLYLKKENPTHEHVISFIDVLPIEFGLEQYVDYETQYDKAFITPLESFTKIIHWNTQETFTLNDFFS